MHRTIAPALLLAALLAACGGSETELKLGGAWPAEPVKCSAYFGDRTAYAACLERDRVAEAAATARQDRFSASH